MKNANWVAALLVIVIMALDASLFIRERAESENEEEEESEAEATFAEAALQQRRAMQRDARGRMPDADALMRARQQADRIRAAGRWRRQTRQPSAGPEETALTVSAVSASATGGAAWRWLGPNTIGGRVRSLAVDPRNPNIIFAGSAGGGIWKTTNRGATWLPCDDFMPALSVSSIVIDPRNSNVLYASTGEPFHNGDSILGAGVFKSTDGGATWPRLPATDPNVNSDFKLSARLALSPDGTVLLVATTFGIYRSTNGGASFARTSTTYQVTQVAFNPSNGAEAIAAGYLGRTLYSQDGGVTWTASAGFTGVPSTSRVEVAYSRSDGSIYASVDVGSGAVYRSFDGGASFNAISSSYPTLGCQGFYDNAIWVNPRDPNHLVIGGVNANQSFDGGATWRQMDAAPYHPDYHVIVEDTGFDDVNNRTLYLGNDGGVFRTTDVRNTGPSSSTRYERLNNNLGVTQFYGAAGNVASGEILGGTQDNGSVRYSPASGTTWTSTGGGDVGFVAADQTDPNYFYDMAAYLSIYRTTTRGASWESLGSGISNGLAANFIAPLVLDPNNVQRLYAGGNDLWRTDTAKGASPNFSSVKPPIGAGQNYISAIAIAEGNSNIVWVGYNAGDVYKTTNATSSTPAWTRLTSFGSYISRITIDPSNPQDVFVTRTGYQPDNIRHSTDGGMTWSVAAGSGTTALPFAPVYDVEIDPQNPNTLFAATEVGVFVSPDRGQTWDADGEGPANTRIAELFWMERTLIAVTHGRGMFALDLNPPAGTPAVSLSPSSLAFPSQTVNTTSAARSVTVGNTGTAPLVVQSATVAGPQASEFSIAADGCTGATVAPGANCVVQVRFRPSATGTRSASLVLSDNAPTSPQTVPMSGTGASAPSGLPSPWSASDIGAVGVPGTSAYSSGTFTVSGSGADVWGTDDAFQFAYQPITGDATIVARVASVQNVNVWTKAGVMIRQALTASSAHAAMFVTPGKGLAFQRRTSAGGTSVSTVVSGTAPRWVKLSRVAQVMTASVSADGSSWTTVGQQSIVMSGTIWVGLAITSHDNTQAGSATFDNVAVSTPAAPLPAGWQNTDVGSVGVDGSAVASNGTFSIDGAGADVWNAADAFHYAYTTLAGDGEIVARVASVEYVAAWTKVGVMIRGSLTPSAAHAFMLVSAGKGLAFQRRTSAGGISTSTPGGTGTAPYWVRLVRSGSTITASASTNGVTWTTVDQDTLGISGTVYIGLAVSSHDTTRAATATFDNVTVR
jgi:regulation of enolase protein 1 (concanavalin A-like superfamily)